MAARLIHPCPKGESARCYGDDLAVWSALLCQYRGEVEFKGFDDPERN